jgi:hypothetical protein
MRRIALGIGAGLLLFAAAPALAVVEVSPIPDIQFGSWNPGSGDVQASADFCVASAQGTSARNYRVRVEFGVFELVNTLDPSQTVPVRIYYEDLLKNKTEPLAPDTWTGRNKRGVASCSPLQINGRLRVEIDAVDLLTVGVGTYRTTRTLTAERNGGDQDTEGFAIEITIGETAWVQRLDPIVLNYTPGSDATGNEAFCIWSSTGSYDVTISSQIPTGSTTFFASGQTTPANTVSYAVRFDTDGTAVDGAPVTEGSPISNQPTTESGDPPSCTSDNTSIHVTFPESGNLAAAPADTYTDELSILVQPR